MEVSPALHLSHGITQVSGSIPGGVENRIFLSNEILFWHKSTREMQRKLLFNTAVKAFV